MNDRGQFWRKLNYLLARRVFDAAICHPNLKPIDALQDWLDLIAGMGGYLCCTASAVEGGLAPLSEHLRAVGDSIEKAGKVAKVLANQVESDMLSLANQLEGRGHGGAA